MLYSVLLKSLVKVKVTRERWCSCFRIDGETFCGKFVTHHCSTASGEKFYVCETHAAGLKRGKNLMYKGSWTATSSA